MSATLEFILERAHETHSVMAQLVGKWEFDEITPAAYLTAITALETQRNTSQNNENDMLQARGVMDNNFADLHARTVQYIGMAKAKYRADLGKMNVLNPLTADGQSRGGIMQQGNECKIAWNTLDATWAPTTTNTLVAFTTLLALCKANLDSFTDKKDLFKEAAGTLKTMSDDLEDISQAWYAAATRAFKTGTPEGELIRTIPTTTQVSVAPDKATLSTITKPTSFTARLVYDANHATKFNIYQKSPGFTEFGMVGNNITDRSRDIVVTDGAGTYQFKVIGMNDEGSGPESDVKSVTFP